MVQADEYERDNGPGQYLVPGEKLLRYSSSVGIKKFGFHAYITDKRIFLIDKNEKKAGIISKDIPREVVMGSHLEASGTSDPYLVLTIRTAEDETRTLKISFIQEGNDRTAEIEEWISLLHGRTVRPVKSATRHREFPVTVQRDDLHRGRPHEKISPPYSSPGTAIPDETYRDEPEKVLPRQQGNQPVTRPVIMGEQKPGPGQDNEQIQEGTEIAFCHHCGKRAPAGANFCPFCGTKLHRPDRLIKHEY